MGDSSTNMLAPKVNEENFGFGFNDKDFSDRVLHIEIIQDDSLPPGIEVDILNVNSIVLAAKSPFFYKLFKNGMIESQSKDVTLKIYSFEKVALMELLKFIYNNTLSMTSTRSNLMDVLLVADKFEVTSCMKHCIRVLLKMPMSLESVLSYLELPSVVLVNEVVQPLIDASKQYLVKRYKNFKESREEVMKLPLIVVEYVLGSDSRQVDSEDDVYDFVLKWSRAHYSELKDRQQIIAMCLSQLICFEHMSCSKLKEVLVCVDFDHEDVKKLVVNALFYKIEVPYGQHIHSVTKSGLSRRVYNDRLIKVVEFETPWPRCVIYFDLNKKEFENLYSSKSINSQPFLVDGRRFYLDAYYEMEDLVSSAHIGLLMHMHGSKTCTVNFEVSFLKKSSKKFKRRWKLKNLVVEENVGMGVEDVFEIDWTTFMGDDSEYFIDGILHLRVDLTVVNSQG